MRPGFFLAILFIGFLSPLWGNETKVQSTINGQILNSSNRTVDLFFYDNFIDFEEKSFRLPLQSDGRFTLELFIEEGITITLTHNNLEQTIYLEPGDQLDMIYDVRFNHSIPTFSGIGSNNNKYLAEARNKFKLYTAAHIRAMMVKDSPEQFKEKLDAIKQEKFRFFKQNSLSLSTKGYAFAKAEIEFWWANALLQYRWEHPAPGDAYPLELPMSYFQFLEQLKINNPLALTSLSYANFLKEFLDFKADLNKDQGFGHPLYHDANRYVSGIVFEFVKANAYYTAIKRKKYEWHQDEIQQFIERSPAIRYRGIIKKALETSRKLESGDLAPDFSLVDKDGRMVRLSDFRGKVVYLDFWATWCPPCIQELPYSSRLSRQFSADDVVFVYISLDRNLPSWKNYLKNNSLKGVHLFAAQVFKSDVVKDYHVKGLPSYFIIDKQGRVTENRAPRPSDPKCAASIRKAINQTIH